jgi:hypothetical protein
MSIAVGLVLHHQRLVVADHCHAGTSGEDLAETAGQPVVSDSTAHRRQRGDEPGENFPAHGFSTAICSTPLAPLR